MGKEGDQRDEPLLSPFPQGVRDLSLPDASELGLPPLPHLSPQEPEKGRELGTRDGGVTAMQLCACEDRAALDR